MAGYTSAVRVGNWSEESQALAETTERLQDARAAGTLRSDVHSARMAGANARRPLRHPGDGLLRLGEVCRLESAAGWVLAACLHDAVLSPDERACAAALAQPDAETESAATRCCLVLESVAPRTAEDEAAALQRIGGAQVAHYGQKVRLRLAPEACQLAPPRLRDPPAAASAAPSLALRSGPVTVACVARASKHQLVSFSALCGSQETVFVLLTPQPAQQLASEGQPILLGAPLLIKHAATQQCLAAETFSVLTDWGNEREVSAHNYQTAGHKDSLLHVNAGAPEAAVGKGMAEAFNVWRFV